MDSSITSGRAETIPIAFQRRQICALLRLFLAKLTDHDHDIAALLRRRVFDLYGWCPALEREPPIPVGHASLKWADPLSPVADLESLLRQCLSAKPRSTAAQIARQIGWAFSDFEPDTQVGAVSV